MDNNKKQDPTWKQDFPIQSTQATQVSRRDFAKFLCLLSGGLAFGNLFVFSKYFTEKTEKIDEQFVCHINDVPIGGTRSFVLKNSEIPYILIHLENGEWRAYEQKCTHLSCAVFYKPNTGKIECPCHNGWFDAYNGEPIQGPPPRALPKLDVVIKGEQIFVKSPDKTL